jgi:hypothetical protein
MDANASAGMALFAFIRVHSRFNSLPSFGCGCAALGDPWIKTSFQIWF